jgi:osmotically-inducible protein OsmY
MKTDADIRRDVQSELQWDPGVDDRRIAVAVDNGVVTFTGEVSSYCARMAVETVGRRIVGVRAIANDVDVKFPCAGVRSDCEIAEGAALALASHFATRTAAITPIAREGHVTLTGKVHWPFQKSAADNAVRHVVGIMGVTNQIEVEHRLKTFLTNSAIAKVALHRSTKVRPMK